MAKEIKKLDTDFVQVVPWSHIEHRWGKREFKRFEKWMRGQTATDGGCYISDVITYAEQRNRGIKNPNCYD